MRKTIRTILAVLAVGITIYALWFQNRPVELKTATHEDVLAEAEKGGYRLIDTGKLWEQYRKKPNDTFIVDTRQEWEYRTGHIKGAVNFPMEPTWLSRWKKSDAMEKFLGPDNNRFIVFY
jgi:rhodanese-related sulfurtransferase